MELFRRKQKLIFWIVTLIIVPSFVLVWGVNPLLNDQGSAPDVGSIDGQRVTAQDFQDFSKRLNAAIGGLPLQFAAFPSTGKSSEEVWKYMMAYAVLKDAEKAGLTASEVQVGTYIERSHPTIASNPRVTDAASVNKAVEDLCRQLQMTQRDFIQGVREWQTIGNYIFANNDLTAVTDDNAYNLYAFTKAECVIKRVRISENDDIREQAKKEVTDKPEEELDSEIRNYVAGKVNQDRRYRDPAGWRFEWLLTPYVSESAVRQPTDAEIEERYQQGKESWYQGQSFDEARDRIIADLIRVEVERQTARNMTIDVDSQLRSEEVAVALADLVKMPRVAKYGVTFGSSGDELLNTEELVKVLPAGSEFMIRFLLDDLDGQPAEVRNPFLEKWKKGFIVEELSPFRSDLGYYRLRLLDYRPSTPAVVDAEDGSIRPEIRELALVDMVGDRVKTLVEEKALATEQRLRDYLLAKESGTEAPDAELAEDFASLPEEVIPYTQIPDEMVELGRLPIGDLMGPLNFNDVEIGTRGQELLVMVDRRMPSRADFAAEPVGLRNQIQQSAADTFRGRYGFSYTTSGPNAIIYPDPSVLGSLVERINTRRIVINPEWLRDAANEG